MMFSIDRLALFYFPLFFIATLLCSSPSWSAAQTAPDLDLSIHFFNRELSSEGVLHENSYDEKMMRRAGHVWTERALPKLARLLDKSHPNQEHKDFNYIALPRLVTLDANKISVEFINTHDRQRIFISPTEYENVNFDGSWLNTYYLVDPKVIAVMPVTSKRSKIAHTQWHEVEKNGLFQRVLWDKKLEVPLLIETGDKAGTFLHRIQIRLQDKLAQDLPWQHLQGYTLKEYSDFLD